MCSDSAEVGAVVLDLEPYRSGSKWKVSHIVKDVLYKHSAHNGVFRFADEGADLTLWLGAFLCIATDDVRRKACLAS